MIEPETIPEVVRKAFKQAQTGRFGVSYIDFPENVAKMDIIGWSPLPVQPTGAARARPVANPTGGRDDLDGPATR